MKIVVIGSGYVGTTLAALLANSGYNVTAIDIDESKVAKINVGKAPFFEAGLDQLLSKAVNSGTLSASSSYESLVNADVVFSCVGTPDNPDGSSNLDYVFAAAEEASKHMKPSAVFVQKSTVPVGTGGDIDKRFTKVSKAISYVSSPEFLREGTAIRDSLWPDRLVVGGSDTVALKTVSDLYRSIEDKRDELARTAGITPPASPPASQYFSTNRTSAELIKVTANAFLALKISFANSIAKLADATGADIAEVMDVVGADRRIGRAFLDAGRGYGGGCFPKDVTGLISSATKHGVDLAIMTAATELNESMPGYIANKIYERVGDLKGKTIAVLGLSFKAGTSDARKSPGVALANILSHAGASVKAYDPQANGEAEAELRKDISVCHAYEETVKDCDIVCVTTAWPEFLELDLAKLAEVMKGNVFIDAVNSFSKPDVAAARLTYIGVGR